MLVINSINHERIRKAKGPTISFHLDRLDPIAWQWETLTNNISRRPLLLPPVADVAVEPCLGELDKCRYLAR
jgi:hypothetical protein